MAAPDPFNSVGGYTVGIPPLPIISANGDITAGNISGDNLNITSDIHAGGNIYGTTFFGTFAGAISGGLTVPGLTTQVLYNTNGDNPKYNLPADRSPDSVAPLMLTTKVHS